MRWSHHSIGLPLLIGIFPLLQAAAADKPPPAHRYGRKRRDSRHFAIDHVVDMCLRTSKVSGNFGSGQDFITNHHTTPVIFGVVGRKGFAKLQGLINL
jgi:hypothetical protein